MLVIALLAAGPTGSRRLSNLRLYPPWSAAKIADTTATIIDGKAAALAVRQKVIAEDACLD